MAVVNEWLDRAPLTAECALPLLLSDLWNDLDINPMRPLKVSIQLRDVLVRAQPLLTQVGEQSLLYICKALGD